MPEEQSKIKEIGGLFIFIFFAAIISSISIYFEIKEALFAFITSLFFIYVIPFSRYSSIKNIVGSYIIASVIAFLVIKILSPIFSALNLMVMEILLIVIVLFASEFLIILFGMEHPPAIAITLFWLFAELSLKKMIGLVICFVIISIIGLIAKKIAKKKGSDTGFGGDLGKDLGLGKGFGGGLDLGKVDKKIKI